MLIRLVECVTIWPQERVNGLLFQDMALCQAWYEAGAQQASLSDTERLLPDRITAWINAARPAAEETLGRRHQPLLRAMCEALSQNRHKQLVSDELAFLSAAYGLLDLMPNSSEFARLRELLHPHRAGIMERRKVCPPMAGLPALAQGLHYVTEADILQAPMRETRFLAGIELPCRGPVLTRADSVRVLGDVPENCTVVVEGSACCHVDGYVLGRVLSKTSCEVRRNVSGVIVVLSGDIRAKSIINNALVVAKLGSVYCRNAQGPKLIFAGRRIAIADGTMLGHFITRVMDVARDIRGGRIQVSETVQAPHFRHLGGNPLGIVLRRELNCGDFGEVTGAELNRLLSQAYRLRRLIHNFEAMVEISRRDVEHKAQSTLMYLFGGSETHKRLEEIVVLQRRQNMLSRLMENLRGIMDGAQENIAHSGGASAPHLVAEPDIIAVESEEPLDVDLEKEQETAKKLQQSLVSRQLDRRQTSLILSQAKSQYTRLLEEREELSSHIAVKEKEMLSLSQYEKFFSGSPKNTTKLELLQRILPTIKQQPPNSPLAKRLQGGLVAMALSAIERQLRNIQEYEGQIIKNRRDFQAVSERLGKDFQISVLENPESGVLAKAVGHFEAGVRIYLDMFSDDDADLPEGSLLVTPGDNVVHTYTRPRSGFRFQLHSHDE